MSSVEENDDAIARALSATVSRTGPGIGSEPRRVRAYLSDELKDESRSRRAEIDAIVLAAEESIPQKLVQPGFDRPAEMRRLRERGLEESVATFSIDAWRYSLGLDGTGAVPPTLMSSALKVTSEPGRSTTDAPARPTPDGGQATVLPPPPGRMGSMSGEATVLPGARGRSVDGGESRSLSDLPMESTAGRRSPRPVVLVGAVVTGVLLLAGLGAATWLAMSDGGEGEAEVVTSSTMTTTTTRPRPTTTTTTPPIATAADLDAGTPMQPGSSTPRTPEARPPPAPASGRRAQRMRSQTISLGRSGIEPGAGIDLIDVAHEAPVHRVAHHPLQAGRQRGHVLPIEGQELVLLLAHPTGAVVAHDAQPALIGGVGAAAVPHRAVVDDDAARRHDRLHPPVGDLVPPGDVVEAVRAGHQPGGAVLRGEVGEGPDGHAGQTGCGDGGGGWNRRRSGRAAAPAPGPSRWR